MSGKLYTALNRYPLKSCPEFKACKNPKCEKLDTESALSVALHECFNRIKGIEQSIHNGISGKELKQWCLFSPLISNVHSRVQNCTKLQQTQS